MVQLVRVLTQARRGAESMRHTTHKASPHTTAEGCAAADDDDDDEGVHPHTDTLLMQPSTVSLQCNTSLRHIVVNTDASGELLLSNLYSLCAFRYFRQNSFHPLGKRLYCGECEYKFDIGKCVEEGCKRLNGGLDLLLVENGIQ